MPSEGEDAKSDVFKNFHEYAAQAYHDQGTKLRILYRAHHQFVAGRRHFFDDIAVDLRAAGV